MMNDLSAIIDEGKSNAAVCLHFDISSGRFKGRESFNGDDPANE
jgi:hypothetical protein